jgi:hypothetical protein
MKDLLNDIQIVSEIVADLTGSNFIIELNELNKNLKRINFTW